MKNALRQSMLEKRKALSQEDVQRLSRRVIENLIALPQFKQAQNVLFYVSKDNEVFTHALIKESFDKNAYIPFMKGDIKVSVLSSFDELEEGAYGILEPRDAKEVDAQLDVVIVPGLAFDKKGNRIGYGKGYYDIFLKKTNAVKIGLAFDFQLVDQIEHESHDVLMDIIVTETNAHHTR